MTLGYKSIIGVDSLRSVMIGAFSRDIHASKIKIFCRFSLCKGLWRLGDIQRTGYGMIGRWEYVTFSHFLILLEAPKNPRISLGGKISNTAIVPALVIFPGQSLFPLEIPFR